MCFYRLNYKNHYLINLIIQKNINLKKKFGGFESEIKKDYFNLKELSELEIKFIQNFIIYIL